MDEIRKKILRAIEDKGLNLKSVSKGMGRDSSYMHQYIHKGSPRRLNEENRHRLAEILGVEEIELRPSVATTGKKIVVLEKETDYIDVPVYDIAVSAGGGAVVQQENIIYQEKFHRQWLRSITHAPVSKLAVIRVEGESMMPTLSPDDTVLVDMSQNYPRTDGIYVVVYDNSLMVKRVRIDPVRKTAAILSDNPLYTPVENLKPEEIKIAGRVVWLGRRV